VSAEVSESYDVVIIGSGVGGGSVALTLAGTGARILILERGERLPREAENWSPEAVFVEQRYRTRETWYDGDGKPFRPGQFYFVGGHTKVYGTAMFRFRERDFEGIEHADGNSVPWPVRYADLEPWYGEAERLFGVHGKAGDDPTEPPPASADSTRADHRQSIRTHARARPASLPHALGGRPAFRWHVHSLRHLRCFSMSSWRQG